MGRNTSLPPQKRAERLEELSHTLTNLKDTMDVLLNEARDKVAKKELAKDHEWQGVPPAGSPEAKGTTDIDALKKEVGAQTQAGIQEAGRRSEEAKKEIADKAKQEKSEKEKSEKEKTEKESREKAEQEKAWREKEEQDKAEQKRREQKAVPQQEANVVYKFSGMAPSVWEGGGDDSRFDFNRTKAKFHNPDKMCGEASVAGKVWGKIDTAGRKIADCAAEFEAELKAHKSWGRGATLKSFSVDGFTGQMVETKVSFIGGGWSDEGFRASEASASTHGYVFKGNQVIEFGYNVNGVGCFNNTDRAFLESQVAAGQGEARGILSSLKLVKDGKFEKIPYQGPKLDGSSLPKISLSPSTLKPLKIGETVTITAVVENAEPEDSPFSYTWTGEFSGKGSAVTLTAKTPGKATVSVSVDGARYPQGSASLEYEVEAYKVSIERVPGTQSPVAVGASVGLKATLLSGGKPVAGDYIYRWQPHPEAEFKDLDSKSNQTTVTFSRPGSTKVWVQVLKKEGEILTTVAESDPLEINITEPSILAGEEATPETAEDPANQAKNTGSDKAILGKYSINANGYTGFIILSQNSGTLEGVVNFGGNLEILQNISFDGTTLTFTRPIPNLTQVYTGKISGSVSKRHFEGEFTQQGTTATYKWFADMTVSAKLKAQQSSASYAALSGKYSFNANGMPGQIIFSQKAGTLEGELNFGSGPEKLRDIHFDGTVLTFTRPMSAIRQVYTGKISGTAPKWHFEGEFGEGGGPAIYKWVAEMVEPAVSA